MTQEKGLSRRDFLKDLAAGSAIVVVGGALSGCSPELECPPCPTPEAGAVLPASGETLPGGLPMPNFMKAPAPISDDQITETIEADVVVIGAGAAGLCAAVSANRAGAKTIVMQKGPMPLVQGWFIGAYNTEQQKAAGVEFDIQEYINAHMAVSGNWPNHNLLKLYAENSAAAIKMLDEIMVSKGHNPAMFMDFEIDDYPRIQTGQTIHGWDVGFVSAVMEVVTEVAKEEGVEFYFDNPAAQLIQDETGRVVGAISETPDGEYNKFMAGKGVILASGGFAGNDEMKAYYGRHALGIPTARMPEKNYSGDGIKMALWIGGAFQAGPAAIGAHYNPVQGAGIPFMFVDATGVRFMNEDNPIERIANQDMTLIPGRYHWQVFDNSYADDLPKFYSVFDKELVEPAEGAGVLVKADTLEGLAELMEVPGDVFVEQVEKYNQYVADGKDLQFGKNPDFLTALDEAPFYAIKRVPALLETSGGLDVDLQLRVKDDEGKSISGLYAVGSVAGNCFGPDYPMIMNGASNGRAVTFGMLAGQYAAAENV